MGAEGRALHSRLPEGHSEQGIRPSLGEQGHCLNKLLFHILSSCRLGLWSREPVELGVSVLEGPVMFYWGSKAWQRKEKIRPGIGLNSNTIRMP